MIFSFAKYSANNSNTFIYAAAAAAAAAARDANLEFQA